MSYERVRAVLERSEAKGTARLVLIVLAEHIGKNDEPAWPSVETIASEAKLSERQVQYRLKELELLGEIADVTPPKGERKHRSRDWAVVIRGAADCTPDAQKGADATTPDCTPEVQPIAPMGAADSTPEVQPIAPKPYLEPSVSVNETFTSEEAALRAAYDEVAFEDARRARQRRYEDARRSRGLPAQDVA